MKAKLVRMRRLPKSVFSRRYLIWYRSHHRGQWVQDYTVYRTVREAKLAMRGFLRFESLPSKVAEYTILAFDYSHRYMHGI